MFVVLEDSMRGGEWYGNGNEAWEGSSIYTTNAVAMHVHARPA